LALTPTDDYRRNLAALAARQPAVAETVEAAFVPDSLTPAIGRDGSATYHFATDSGSATWFGHSSMPSISAEALFTAFHGGDGNVSLPGIFSGREALVLLDRMPQHLALFVIEQDPLNLKLAMSLHRYEEFIRAGRLVFVLGAGDTLVDSLQAFFSRYPGYEWPTHMLTMPQLSPARVADLQRVLVRAADVVAGVQVQAIESHARAIRARVSDRLPDSPRVALLSLDPRPVSLDQARRIQRALASLKLPHAVCVPESPDKCHMAARTAVIAEFGAELVFLVNSPPCGLHTVVGDSLPMVAWYGPEAVVQPLTDPPWSEKHMAFAADRNIHKALITAGVPEYCVHMCAPAADATSCSRMPPRPVVPDAAEIDVAVLADVPNDRPEASGIDLASHISLWEALRDIVTRRADAYRDDLADKILDKAEQRSGVHLRDAAMRGRFLTLIRDRIAPAAVARVAATSLVGAGHRVGVWGRGWSIAEFDQRYVRGPIPTGEALGRVLSAIGAVVFPGRSGTWVQTSLDALAVGRPVICRQPNEPFEHEYPGLAELRDYLSFYMTSKQLLKAVGKAVNGDERVRGAVETSQSIVLASHSLTTRIHFILENVRQQGQAMEQRLCGQS